MKNQDGHASIASLLRGPIRAVTVLGVSAVVPLTAQVVARMDRRRSNKLAEAVQGTDEYSQTISGKRVAW
jgi:hypothetical protein